MKFWKFKWYSKENKKTADMFAILFIFWAIVALVSFLFKSILILIFSFGFILLLEIEIEHLKTRNFIEHIYKRRSGK